MHIDAHRFPFHAERFHPPTERAETDSLATEVIDETKEGGRKRQPERLCFTLSSETSSGLLQSLVNESSNVEPWRDAGKSSRANYLLWCAAYVGR